jgi:hypothetical protein
MRRDDANYANVLDTIRVEQEEVQNVLNVLVNASAGAAQVQPFAELKARLRQLMEQEEETLYPTVAALNDDADTVVDTAMTEHDDIEAALVALEVGITTPKITTLATAVNNHFTSERGQLFSFARGVNSNIRHELGMEAGDVKFASVLT